MAFFYYPCSLYDIPDEHNYGEMMTETQEEPQKKGMKWKNLVIGSALALAGTAGLAYGTHELIMANTTFEAPMPVTEFKKEDPATYQVSAADILNDSVFDDNTDWSALDKYDQGGTAGIAIPALDVYSPMIETGSENGTLVLPEAPVSTMYTGAVEVGADQGNTIISSHVNGVVEEGQRAFEGSEFANLHRAESGMPVGVRDKDGEIHEYRVTEMNVYHRNEVPKDIFRTDGDHKVHLVTCSGETIERGDDGFFEYNLIVTAEPVK